MTTEYSRYELAAIHDAETQLGAEVDPDAEGKIIESVETVRYDPIEERDPLPKALNVVHTTTKDYVVRHEMLLRVGKPYRRVLADESARNLREFGKLSVVVVVPLKARRRDRVRLVAITKDIWTLIADVDFHFTRGGAEYLMFELEETNLAGTQSEFSARSIIQPESFSLGGAYVAPRFGGRFLKFHSEANVVFNRRSGDVEGTFGDARISQPLFSTKTPWAWSTGITWNNQVYRRYSNAEVARYDGVVPWTWRWRKIEQSAQVTRSFGWAVKNDVTIGGATVRDLYVIPDQDDYPKELVDRFAGQFVPVGEARTFPFVEWRSYKNDFLRITDFETLALQEDYRLGYDFIVRGYPVTRALGSTRNLFGMRAGAMYTIALGDGFARAMLDTLTEVQDDNIPDASMTGELRLVSPRTPLGRLVFDTWGINRWRNYLNRTSEIGGEDRLRGWPTRYFVGRNVFAMNVEFRSRPIDLSSVQLGMAAFYDLGRAFNGSFEEIRPVQSVGVGFRIVLPQIDRSVIRGDFGFPITEDRPADVTPMSFFFAFHQAFRTSHLPVPFGP